MKRTEYVFSIDTGIFHPHETLKEITFKERFSYPSSVIMYDKNHDIDIDTLFITDNVNNTEATIEENFFGLKVKGMPKEEGKKLLDYYRKEYRKFMQDHRLDEKIRQYQRKIEVQQYK